MSFKFKYKSILNAILFVILLVLLSLSSLRAKETAQIRVGIMFQISQVKISNSYSLKVVEEETSRHLTQGKNFTVTAIRNGLNVNNLYVSRSLHFIPLRPNSITTVNYQRYRGEIVVKNHGGMLMVINVLDVEHYLYGVVGSEMSSRWPMEALKAQAVVARTYARRKMLDNRNKQFDVLATVKDQVYKGISNESPRIIKAVDETSGEVLLYNGDIITAYYHADCGGYTEEGENVFEGSYPYLKSVVCEYGLDSPYQQWSWRLTIKELKQALLKGGFNIGRIYNISLKKSKTTDRVEKLLIEQDGGQILEIEGVLLRKLLGPRKLRSTRFQIKEVKQVAIKIPKKVKVEKVVSYQKVPYIEEKEVEKEKEVTFEEKLSIEVSNKVEKTYSLGQSFHIIYEDGKLWKHEMRKFQPAVVLTPEGKIKRQMDIVVLGIEKDMETRKVLRKKKVKVKEKVAFTRIEKVPVKGVVDKEIYVKRMIPLVLEFYGKGWGHGVGMCQWGARGMAVRGYNYQQILKYYYKDVQIKRL